LDHDWLEGRGERFYLISVIDDATSRLYARFFRSDSTAENMRVLWGYVEQHGRPLAFYTDKASLFQTAQRQSRDELGVRKDPVDLAVCESPAPTASNRPMLTWNSSSCRGGIAR